MASLRSRRLVWLGLVLGLVLLLTVCVEDVDAAKKKKTKKKATADAAGDSKDDGDKSDKKVKKDGKVDWSKMTKKDWDRLENEQDDEDAEPWKPPEPPKMAFDPENPMEYIQAQKKGKPGMMFATLDLIKDAKTGEKRKRTKEETEEVAFRHKSLLQSGHIDATPYVIEDNQILWTTQDGSKGYDVQKFLMRQPEVDEFDWDQQKTKKDTWKDPDAEL